MENSKSKEGFLRGIRSVLWRRRSVLERVLILGVLVLLLVFFVKLGLLIHFKSVNTRNNSELSKGTNTKKKKEVCLDSICKYQAGYFLTHMNFAVDPCENFYEFACGSYLKFDNIYNDEILVYSTLANYMIYLRKEELEKPNRRNDPRFIKKVKRYYESCLAKSAKLKDVVKEFLREMYLDVWPHLRNNHSGSTFEDAAAAATVYKNSGSLFNIHINSLSIILDSEKSSQSDVLLNATNERYLRIKEKYTDLMNYVFSNLGLSAEDSSQLVQEMIAFEMSLAEIHNRNNNDSFRSLTISELESQCPQIKWKNLLKLVFDVINRPEDYNEKMEILILNMDYINDLCELIGNTKNKRVIYNLVLWDVFIRFLPPFDETLRQGLSDIQDFLRLSERFVFLLPGLPKLKWKSCIRNMELYIQMGLDYMMIKSMKPERDIEEVNKYGNDVRESMRDIFSAEDWMDDYSKNITISKLNNIKSSVGYGNSSVDEKFLNSIFDNINFTDNYVENILRVRKQDFFNMIYYQNISDIKLKVLISDPTNTNSFYIPFKNGGIFVIGLGVMNPPLYHYNLPKYINFAGMGFNIGHELSHGVDNFDKDGEKDGNKWPEKFLQEYKRRKNCFVRQYSQFPIEGNMMINGTATIRDNIADNNGLLLSYRAYEKYLEQHGEEPDLPGLDFSNKQMYFIAYAQNWCEITESLKKKYEFNEHSPNRYRLLVTLMNSYEFSEVFHCPLNSYMNPEHKCRMWG